MDLERRIVDKSNVVLEVLQTAQSIEHWLLRTDRVHTFDQAAAAQHWFDLLLNYDKRRVMQLIANSGNCLYLSHRIDSFLMP